MASTRLQNQQDTSESSLLKRLDSLWGWFRSEKARIILLFYFGVASGFYFVTIVSQNLPHKSAQNEYFVITWYSQFENLVNLFPSNCIILINSQSTFTQYHVIMKCSFSRVPLRRGDPRQLSRPNSLRFSKLPSTRCVNLPGVWEKNWLRKLDFQWGWFRWEEGSKKKSEATENIYFVHFF